MVIKTEKFVCSYRKEQADLKAAGHSAGVVGSFEEIYSRVTMPQYRSYTKAKPIVSTLKTLRRTIWVNSNLGVIAPKGLNEWK